MVARTTLVVLSLLLLLLTACSSNAPGVAQETGPTAPAPSADKSTFTGRVVSSTNQAPIKETVVQLAQIYHDSKTNQAVFALDLARAPGTFTDANGYFVITDVPPGEYAIVVGDYYGTNEVVQEGGNARIFKPEAGKVFNAGVVQVKPNVSPGK